MPAAPSVAESAAPSVAESAVLPVAAPADASLRAAAPRLQTPFELYQELVADNFRSGEREFIVPQRRVCGPGGASMHTVEMSEHAIFIPENKIKFKHPMRFLRLSPFVSSITEEDKEFYLSVSDTDAMWHPMLANFENQTLHAIGLTQNGRHVILQQGVKSCVPTCVGMLVLDHGGIPNYQAMINVNLANVDDAIAWVRNAGLTPLVTILANRESAEEPLLKAISENGSGVLAIDDQVIGGHVIVLDEVCLQSRSAIIRDSFHGWSLTIDLETLLSWIGHRAYFLQIRSESTSGRN